MKTGLLIAGLVIIAIVVGAVVLRRSPQPTAEQLENVFEATTIAPDVVTPSLEDDAARPTVDTPVLDSTPAPTAAATASETVVITMDDSGFTPDTITISAGTVVTFVNNGQGSHWPASALHPTHDVLPGFDAKQGLPTGEEYSYTFTKPGTWHFHDHLMAQHTGTIIVE